MNNIDTSTEASVWGDLFDNEGFLLCPDCKTRTQADVQGAYDTRPVRVSVPCECAKAKFDRMVDEENCEEHKITVERLRSEGMTDPVYKDWTFANDNLARPDISAKCRRYAENFDDMYADNVGLLISGDRGIGKSYMAIAICNYLIEQEIPVFVTSFHWLLNKTKSTKWGDDFNELFTKLQQYKLVVLEDLGTEVGKDTEVALLYNVVDTRIKSGRPLIVTTNLDARDFSTDNLAYARIYDRILEACVPIIMTGESQRKEIGRRKLEKYAHLLG